MTFDRARWLAVALLVAAATLSAYGNRDHDRLLQALSYACFLGAVFVFLGWRRARRMRRDTVSDPEANTSDETRTRAGQ